MKKLSIKKPRKINLKNFYVFDIETKTLNALSSEIICIVIYSHNYKRVLYSCEEFKIEIKKQRYKNKWLFAHNAEFDLTGIFGNIRRTDPQALFNGSSFICMNYEGVKFADSFKLFPTSAKKLGELLGDNKIEVDYEQLQYNIDLCIEYCTKDCEIIYKCLLKLFVEIGEIKITIGSSSLLKFRSEFLKSPIYFDELSYIFKLSYYGGRVECFKLGKLIGHKYDVNSMYPFAMKYCTFPDPSNLKQITENMNPKKLLLLIKSYEGCAHVNIIHKQNHIGYLPYRMNNKLIFPNGTYSGWYNFNELRFAIEKNMIEIKEVYKVIYGNRTESPFKDFVDHFYKLKSDNVGTIYGEIYKMFLNHLYGKFIQKSPEKKIYVNGEPFELYEQYLQENPNTKLDIINSNEYYIVIPPKDEFAPHAIPLYSSYITSFSRLILLEALISNENNIVYCDTDSISLTEKLDLDEKQLGGWKDEKTYISELWGNKMYREIKGDKETLKIKGVKKDSIQDNDTFKYLAMIKTASGIRHKKETGRFIETFKTIKAINNPFIYDKRKVLPQKLGESFYETEPLQL